MKRLTSLCVIVFSLASLAVHAAIITVNSTDATTTPPVGQTNLWKAMTLLQNGDTIQFNIPGPGPHYLQTPPGGYPIITNNNVTLDGYSQPGAVPNTNPILSSNNAQIKIVLTSTNGNYVSMGYEPANPDAGFSVSEMALIGIFNATNVTVRGFCMLGDGFDNNYAIAVARNYSGGAVGLGNGLHVSGCWIGVDVDGTPGQSFDQGVVAYRHADGLIGNAARLPSNRHVVGVKAGSLNPRAEFNVIVGGTINIIMEGQAHRVSGNFLGVLPSGVNDYIVPFAELGRFAEAHIEIGRGASDVVIGTDGDGINDADERNIMTGVVTDGANGSFNLGGYRHVIELYSLSSSPGDDRQRVRVAGNYVGVGIDGVTRFTNGVSVLNGSAAGGTHYWIGSDFDGVSDAIEPNLFYGNYPAGLFYATAYTNSTRSGSGSHGFMDEPSDAAGGYSTRGNSIVNNYPYPHNPRRGNSFANITNYINKALASPTANFEAMYPLISGSSTTARLIGTVPAGNATYPWTILDVYLPDPEGLTNGLVVPDPYLTNGWVHGKTYLGSLADNGIFDSDPAPGAFNFSICQLGLAAGTKITISANYSKDPPGTHNARVLTSLFSPPGTLSAATCLTVNTTSLTPGPGEKNLAMAMAGLTDGATVTFNIPGPGPHYLQTPPGGYPIITNNNVTLDGYSQPGAVPNTNPILSSNNAQIKIVLTSTNGNYVSMGYEPANPDAGFSVSEMALIGIFNATNVTVRGFCMLGDGFDNNYAIAVARNYSSGAVGLGNGLHVSGCWIGVDLDGTPGQSFDQGVVAYRHNDALIGNASRLPSNRHVVGVKAGSLNPRSQFNVIVGGTINIIMEGQAHRVSGNFLGVLPSGVNDYIVPFAELGRFAEAHIEIGRGASDVVIGTDGDGINDADERNVMTGVVTDGANGSFNLGGYRHVIELYSLSSSPGDDRQRVRVAGNYVGVGIDGVTRFTNGVSVLNGSAAGGTHYWIGSDFDGVSDAIERNLFYGNYPAGLFYATAYTNSTRSGSGSHGFMDEPSDAAGGYSTRGNSIVNNYPYPFNPRRGNSFANITNYINKALASPTANFEAMYPLISTNSTVALLVGTVPAGNATYPWTILDLYLPDPEGLTNGLVVPDPYLTNGWVHGKTYLGSFIDNSSADKNPGAGAFSFDICSLGLAPGTKVVISANYSKDPPGTHNARVLTSLFSPPATLGSGVVITSVTRTGSTLTINWCGGTAPYTLQRRLVITDAWSNIQTGLTGTSTTDTISGTSAFYRIQGTSN